MNSNRRRNQTRAWVEVPVADNGEAIVAVCVPRTSSGVLKVKLGNIGDEGPQEQVVM